MDSTQKYTHTHKQTKYMQVVYIIEHCDTAEAYYEPYCTVKHLANETI